MIACPHGGRLVHHLLNGDYYTLPRENTKFNMYINLFFKHEFKIYLEL